MKIEPGSDQPVDNASAIAQTGKSCEEWIALTDALGGGTNGRRDIARHIDDTYKIDPWWIATINIAYEGAKESKEKDGLPKGFMICATRSIKAAPERCFEAFSSTAALDQWLGTEHSLDFSQGGSLRNADGNRVSILKINAPNLIRMTWQTPEGASETPVEIKFQPSGAKTTVIIAHDRLQDRDEADGFRRAWGAALIQLKIYLEVT